MNPLKTKDRPGLVNPLEYYQKKPEYFIITMHSAEASGNRNVFSAATHLRRMQYEFEHMNSLQK